MRSTSSSVIGNPSWFIRSTIRPMRSARSSPSRSEKLASPGSVGSTKWPRMWISRPSASVETSIPGTRRIPWASAAAWARASPFTVSWSVTARAFTPAVRARASRASGESSPSLAVVCECRSIKGGSR